MPVSIPNHELILFAYYVQKWPMKSVLFNSVYIACIYSMKIRLTTRLEAKLCRISRILRKKIGLKYAYFPPVIMIVSVYLRVYIAFMSKSRKGMLCQIHRFLNWCSQSLVVGVHLERGMSLGFGELCLLMRNLEVLRQLLTSSSSEEIE